MDNCYFESGNKCRCLIDKKCDECSFRKTKREVAIGRDMAMARIVSLPTQQSLYIMRKYHNLGTLSQIEKIQEALCDE